MSRMCLSIAFGMITVIYMPLTKRKSIKATSSKTQDGKYMVNKWYVIVCLNAKKIEQ